MTYDKEEFVDEESMSERVCYEGEVVDVNVPSKRIGIVLNTADEEMITLMFTLGKRVKLLVCT